MIARQQVRQKTLHGQSSRLGNIMRRKIEQYVARIASPLFIHRIALDIFRKIFRVALPLSPLQAVASTPSPPRLLLYIQYDKRGQPRHFCCFRAGFDCVVDCLESCTGDVQDAIGRHSICLSLKRSATNQEYLRMRVAALLVMIYNYLLVYCYVFLMNIY